MLFGMGKSGRSLWTQAIKEGKTTKKSDSHSAWTVKSLTAGVEKKHIALERNLRGKQMTGIVLGIDPSLRGTGLSVVEAMEDGSIRYIESLTIKNHPSLSMPECLARIMTETLAIIKRNKPICAHFHTFNIA